MVPCYWPAYLVIKLLNRFLFPLTIKGRENIPASGAFIAACNHLSHFDPPLVSYAVHRPIYHIAKKSLFNNKLFAMVLYSVGAFPIKREGSDIGAMRECLRKLKAGEPLAVFPTGTRVVGDAVLSAKSGVGFMAVKAGVPIIPLKISGTDKVLPKGSKKIQKNPVTIIIGKPVIYSPGESYDTIAGRVLEAINSIN